MHPPSPKVMEDRGIINYCRCRAKKIKNSELRIMNYGRCRSFGATIFEPDGSWLDASQDIRPALHDVGGVLLRWQSNSKLVIQSEAKNPEL